MIINPTSDTLKLDKENQFVYVQAKDKNGKWRDIERGIPSDVISDGTIDLKPNEYWELNIQSYTGGFKTKMRALIKFPEIPDWVNGKTISKPKVLISNEIDCFINASQFIRSGLTKTLIDKYPFEDYQFDRIFYYP